MRILLIRHGESQANVDQRLHQVIPDHEISLSSLGKEQAERAGEIVKGYYENLYGDALNKEPPLSNGMKDINAAISVMAEVLTTGKLAEFKPPIRLWQSPYKRTRETASLIKKNLDGILLDKRESVLLSEQQFGLFDGLDDNEQQMRFPEEYKYFQHTMKYNGKFWARYPQGESPFDTACRIQQFFWHVHRDAEEHGINDIVVVCHGTVSRLFTMMWRNRSPEWYAAEKTPGNCAVRVLEDPDKDTYIYGGHRHGKAWEYHGNKYE